MTSGDAETITFRDGSTSTATPLIIAITPTSGSGSTRSVTLWFNDSGLVRRTQQIGDSPVVYELDPTSFAELGPS